MTRQISILVPCDLQYRDYVGALLSQFCLDIEKTGEPKPFCHQVVSAFNEAFNNLVFHAGASKPVRINLDLTEKQLVIEIDHDGSVFDIETVESPDLDDLQESGMGLYIMKSFMHKLEYSSNGTNPVKILRMTRYLST